MTDFAPVPPPWWSTYFDDAFLRIYRPLLDEERTASEVEAMRDLLALPDGSRVLDVACGWGRHSVELARHGYQITGFDLSPFLLAEAGRQAAAQGVDARWICGDMRELNFRAEFDAAVSLFSSLGYFADDEDDLLVLRGIRDAVVVPGGRLLLETMHRDLIARQYVERDWWETPDGDRVWIERSFDAVAGISHELLSWRKADGAAGEKSHSIRIRSATEWAKILERAGWRPVEWVGGWNLEPFTHLSERLIIVADAE